MAADEIKEQIADEPVEGLEPTSPPPAKPAPPEPKLPDEAASAAAGDDDAEDREPGGDTPEAIRARKEYRRAKKLRQELAERDRDLVRMQERERLLTQAVQARPQQKEELTIEQVQSAIDSGELSPGLGARWLAKREALNVAQQAYVEQTVLQQRERVRSELREYTELVPGLSQRGSAAVERVETELARLESMGYANDDRTVRIAVELAHGTLDSLRQRKGIDSMTRQNLQPHNERPAGGTPPGNSKLDINKAPQDVKDYWAKSGITSDESKRKYLERYQQNQERRAARFSQMRGR